VNQPLELSDIQGLTVRGYSSLPYATFLLLSVERAGSARSVLSTWADEVTEGSSSPSREAMNIAFTADGIRQLTEQPQLPPGFSHAFASGMTAPSRSRLLGDAGDAAPAHWRWGGPATDRIDVLVLLYTDSAATLDSTVDRVVGEAERGGLRVVERLDTDLLSDLEHFGFRDGISQPTIEGMPRSRSDFDVVRAGEFILGYLNEYGQRTERPLLPNADDPARMLPRDPDGTGAADLGRNGTYLVFRHLSQDVDGFWSYMESASRRDGGDDPAAPIRLAAKVVGRWPSGAPLVLSPDHDDPTLDTANAFGYHRSDPLGRACPIGSHIRRSNPRDSLEPSPGTARSWEVNRRHRILRRGRAYSGYPDSAGTERGVHFLCLNANLARQYEFIQHSWVNDPAFNGLEQNDDPLIGPRGHGSSKFVEPAWPIRKRYHDVPKFVHVRGGAYFFLPGIAGLRYLVSGRGAGAG
jgi:Dyp-type peroxidase family